MLILDFKEFIWRALLVFYYFVEKEIVLIGGSVQK
jgi:hypothetical protein